MIRGGANDDILNGDGGGDLIEGESGDDRLTGGSGADILDGGTGSDTADYSSDPAGIEARLGSSRVTDGFGDTDRLISIETIIGSPFVDSFVMGSPLG